MIQRPTLSRIEPRDGQVALVVEVPGQAELVVLLDAEEAGERSIELASCSVRAVMIPPARARPALRVVRGGEEGR